MYTVYYSDMLNVVHALYYVTNLYIIAIMFLVLLLLLYCIVYIVYSILFYCKRLITSDDLEFLLRQEFPNNVIVSVTSTRGLVISYNNV